MTTNKPEVVAYIDMLRGQETRYASLRGDIDQYSLNDGDELIRLSEYEALQAVCDHYKNAIAEITTRHFVERWANTASDKELEQYLSGGIDQLEGEYRKQIEALQADRDQQYDMKVKAREQMEVVGWQYYKHGKWWNGDVLTKDQRKNIEAAGIPVRDLYTTPKPADRQSVLNLSEAARSLGIAQEKGDQGAIDHWGAMVARFEREVMQPVEQQPAADGSLTPVPDELFAAEFNAWWEQHGQFCRAGGGDYERTFAFEAWRHLYPQPTEQKSALDVSALVEALESLLEMQDEDCRYDHQGYCQNHNLDHVDDGCRVARAKTALAACRKQGDQS